MIKTPASKKVHSVRLDKPKPEDGGVSLSPARVWAAIEPAAPDAFGEDKVTHIVTTDYHPEITLNTRVRTNDERIFWVRGIQDVELRHLELRLLCEEVLAR